MRILKLLFLSFVLFSCMDERVQSHEEWKEQKRILKKSLTSGYLMHDLTIRNRMIKKGEPVTIALLFDPKMYEGCSFSIPGVGKITKDEFAKGEWFVTLWPEKTMSYEIVVTGKSARKLFPPVEIAVAGDDNKLINDRYILLGLNNYEPINPGEEVEVLVVFDPKRMLSLTIPGKGELSKEELAKGEYRFNVRPEKTTSYFFKTKVYYSAEHPEYSEDYFIEVPVKGK